MLWQNLSTASLLSVAIATLPAAPVLAQTMTAPEPQQGAMDTECRLVNINRGGLNVRQEPSLGSPVVAVLADGADVAIVNRGSEGWVPITAPVNGFVAARYLAYCGGVGGPANPVVPNECREVDATSGLNVRERPSIQSRVVGVLANERTVNVGDRTTDGWVAVQSPLQGYVYGAYLDTCTLNQAN